MSDIFLSYVMDDVDKAEKLRDAFRQQGWTVWWSPLNLYRGNYTEALDSELKDAKVIVALWSRRAARRYSFVRKTLERAEITPRSIVLLDKFKPSLVYKSLREFDLSDWDGSESHTELTFLMLHIGKLIAKPSAPAKPPASIEDLSLSEIQENARQGIKEGELSRLNDDTRFKGIFISYRRDEAKAHAKWFYDRLAARFGRENVFLDLENVGLGKNFVDVIKSASESCAVMIPLISRQWLRGAGGQSELDDFVRLEVATALRRHITVIPILLPGASMPSPKDLPDDLAPLVYYNGLPLSEKRWERDVGDLIENLESLWNN